MIIQCDQCNTRFRLDDSKVSEKGAKVRCAKCKHVFTVQRETPAEEPDLDFLLSGLGATTPDAEEGVSKSGEVATPAAGGEEWPGFARGADTVTGNELGETATAGSTAPAGHGEFGADFFSAKAEAAVQEDKGYEFGEFRFAEEQSSSQSGTVAGPEAASGETAGFEFGDFSFEAEETALPSGTLVGPGTAPAKTEEFDFGAAVFETSESAVPRDPEGWRGVAAGELEEELFIFGEEQAGLPSADKGDELKLEHPGDVGEAFDFGSVAIPSQQEREAETAPIFAVEEKMGTEAESLDSHDIDFGETIFAEPGMAKKEEIKPGSVFPEPVTEKPSTPSFVSQMPSADEELPPLAASARRKENSLFPIVVTAIAVLIVLVIAGAGFYIFREGPAGFDKLGLTSLAKWSGFKVVEEGGIAVKNLQGVFLTNQAGGEIFVISGEAVNNYKKPRASIQAKATILGPKGETLMQKSAYCGNSLSKEQLTTLPMAKIEEAMGSPFGDSLANLGVQPGKVIPFVIVFSGVPKDAAEFSVEVAGSTVASQ
jgi:predicted Zn finger-like uncharacterized protein